MKKLSKVFVCIALALGLTFGLTACSVGEVEENTKTAVETTTSIIPVEYTQATAEGIFHNALYEVLSSDKVELNVEFEEIEGAASYNKIGFHQKVMIKDGKRYVLLTDVLGASTTEYVVGTYGNRQYLLNLDTKKYTDITPTQSEPGLETVVPPIIARLDMLTSLVKELSDKVVSGRYFDGATYINLKSEEGLFAEAKIVNGKIVTIETFAVDSGAVGGWGVYSFSYGNDVDVSMIPSNISGFTANA